MSTQGASNASMLHAASRGGEPIDESSLLAEIAPHEAYTVLRELLAEHPELKGEAARLARDVLGDVSHGAVADDVENAVRRISWRAMYGRTGRHETGYTSPTDAAWELLHEVVEPFLAQLHRYLDLDLQLEALEWCKGIVLGLYRVEGSDGLLSWAQEFPSETAAAAIELCGEAMRAGSVEWPTDRPESERPEPQVLPLEFIDEHLPSWRSWMMVLR